MAISRDNPYTSPVWSERWSQPDQILDRGNSRPAYTDSASLMRGTWWENNRQSASPGRSSASGGSSGAPFHGVRATRNQDYVAPYTSFTNRLSSDLDWNDQQFNNYLTQHNEANTNMRNILRSGTSAANRLLDGGVLSDLNSASNRFTGNMTGNINRLESDLNSALTDYTTTGQNRINRFRGDLGAATAAGYSGMRGELGNMRRELAGTRDVYGRDAERLGAINTNKVIGAMYAGNMVNPAYGGRQGMAQASEDAARIALEKAGMSREDATRLGSMGMDIEQWMAGQGINNVGLTNAQQAALDESASGRRFSNLGAVFNERRGLEGTRLATDSDNIRWVNQMIVPTMSGVASGWANAGQMASAPIGVRQSMRAGEGANLLTGGRLGDIAYWHAVAGDGGQPYMPQYGGFPQAQPSPYTPAPYRNPRQPQRDPYDPYADDGSGGGGNKPTRRGDYYDSADNWFLDPRTWGNYGSRTPIQQRDFDLASDMYENPENYQ